MGIDSLFYVMADPDEHPEVMAGLMAYTKGGPGSGRWFVDQHEDHVEIWSGDRYYGPAYPRGDWPQIRDVITTLQGAYPGLEIRYGNDSDDGPEMARTVTTEWLAEMDQLWEAEGRP